MSIGQAVICWNENKTEVFFFCFAFALKKGKQRRTTFTFAGYSICLHRSPYPVLSPTFLFLFTLSSSVLHDFLISSLVPLSVITFLYLHHCLLPFLFMLCFFLFPPNASFCSHLLCYMTHYSPVPYVPLLV